MLFGFSAGPWFQQTNSSAALPRSASNYYGLVGLLPNFELGLSFLTPSLFNGQISDRAGAFKWAIVPERPNSFSFAVGSTDFYGTGLRTTQYAVAGQQAGSIQVYGGYAQGLLGGPMAGASAKVDRDLDVIAERVSGTNLAGVKVRLGKRITLAAACNERGGTFLGAGYTVPLKSPELSGPTPATADHPLANLPRRLSSIGHGEARASEDGGEIRASYDDVDARAPIQTLSKALRLCVEAASGSTQRIQLTVRRLGFNLVTISGPFDDIRCFLNGWETAKDFLAAVSIEDGPDQTGPVTEGDKVAGISPSVQVTLNPGIGYSLGILNDLPNKEFIEADGVIRLPAGVLGAVATNVNLHNSLDDSSVVQPPTMAFYRTDNLDAGLWTMVGLDRNIGEPWEATLQGAYFSPELPLHLFGSVSRPLLSDVRAPQVGFSAEADVDFMSGAASLFARRERFLAGDIGDTFGMTRRFGETWLTLEIIDTREDNFHIQRAGVLFSIPLPEAAVGLGPVRVSTAPTTQFSYLEVQHDTPTFGLGVPKQNLLSPTLDLTARGELTSSYIRQRVDSLRIP
jgi:hypothetical protein